jgi:hypothetical protein
MTGVSMNRRALMAGMAALASTGTVVAQDATPSSIPSADDLLYRYRVEVISGRNFDLIYDLFDSEAFDLDEVYWAHVEEDAPIHSKGVTPGVAFYYTCDQPNHAFGYGSQRMGDGRNRPVMYLLTSAGGKITELVRMTDRR